MNDNNWIELITIVLFAPIVIMAGLNYRDKIIEMKQPTISLIDLPPVTFEPDGTVLTDPHGNLIYGGAWPFETIERDASNKYVGRLIEMAGTIYRIRSIVSYASLMLRTGAPVGFALDDTDQPG